MNGLPYYPRYPRDFFDGTAGMCFEDKAAYGLVLDLIYMMGERGLPDDPHFIAGHLGMSVRKWNTVKGRLIAMGKLYLVDGIISNKRADNVKIIQRKYQDKQSENRARPNKNNELQSPASHHTNTNTNTNIGGGDSARGASSQQDDLTFRERLILAMGCRDASGLTGRGGKMIGTQTDMIEVARWQGDLGLSEDEILTAVAGVMRSKNDGPPSSFAYFTGSMERLAATKAAPPLQPDFTQQRAHTAAVVPYPRIRAQLPKESYQ